MPAVESLPRLSTRTAHLREAGLLRTLTSRVQAFPDGINLGQGVCDLEMPRPLRLAAVEALFQDRQTYTPFAGLRELREAVALRMQRRHGLPYGPEEVVVTVGSSMAYTAAVLTLLDPGDALLLFEPFYPYHLAVARLAGAEVLTVAQDHRGVDWDGLRAALGPRVRAVVVNTPSNPVGRVWTASDLDRLAALLEGTRVAVITDEIYEDLVYDGARHLPPAGHPGLFDRTVTISGVSKSFSVTGWRLGWMAAPTATVRAIGPVFDVMAVCAPRPLQRAAAAALRELGEDYYEELRQDYAQRRKILAEGLRAAGMPPLVPDGAYYMFADTRPRYGNLTPEEACFRLLEEAHIASIPASLFYRGPPPPYLRFHFAAEADLLREAARRLAR
jgi:aminotransferase